MIPKTAHFVWIGNSLDWPYLYALASAYETGGFDQVILHHTDELQGEAITVFKKCYSSIIFKLTCTNTLFQEVGDRGNALIELYNQLPEYSSKTDLIRLVVLYIYGGVYIDLDTLTLKPFESYLDTCEGFFGMELGGIGEGFLETRPGARIAYNAHHTKKSRKSKTALLKLFKYFCAKKSNGWKFFFRYQKYYLHNVNNAVLGAIAGAEWVNHLINTALSMPLSQSTRRLELGPKLLQREMMNCQSKKIKIFSPEIFYVLPALISQHWFKKNDMGQFENIIKNSHIIHWYASWIKKSTLEKLNPDEVISQADTIPYCHLVKPYALKLKRITSTY